MLANIRYILYNKGLSNGFVYQDKIRATHIVESNHDMGGTHDMARLKTQATPTFRPAVFSF
jgi:hypothetical protein